jgi:hypothetical protein
MGRRESVDEGAVGCFGEGHVYRKGYYMGSDADYVCVFCGGLMSEAKSDAERAVFQRPPRRLGSRRIR